MLEALHCMYLLHFDLNNFLKITKRFFKIKSLKAFNTALFLPDVKLNSEEGQNHQNNLVFSLYLLKELSNRRNAEAKKIYSTPNNSMKWNFYFLKKLNFFHCWGLPKNWFLLKISYFSTINSLYWTREICFQSKKWSELKVLKELINFLEIHTIGPKMGTHKSRFFKITGWETFFCAFFFLEKWKFNPMYNVKMNISLSLHFPP